MGEVDEEVPMYSSMWTFAWDLRNEGVDRVLGFASDLGLKAVSIATSYHAGMFILPHSPKGKVYFPEDGVVYFHPESYLYKDTPIKPKVAEISKSTDWVEEAGKRAERFGLKLVSWTVCLHNTRLGMAYPGHVMRNAFGDPYYHAICPGNEDVRAYLKALVKDLSSNYPFYAIELESPGFMGMEHGHHHERYGTILDDLEKTLMSLCFCESCMKGGAEAGVDTARVRSAVKEHLADVLKKSPYRPAKRPRDMAGMTARHPELFRFIAFRRRVELTLLREIKREMVKSSRARLFILSDPEDIEPARIGDAIETIATYHKKPTEVYAITSRARAALGRCLFHAGVRVGFGGVSGPGDLADIVRSVEEAGGDGVLFYNYSEAPMECLRWIKPALAGLG